MLIGSIALISSFCTMVYSMILASILSDFTGEEVYSQCLTIGPYLLGLGLGSLLFDKNPKQQNLNKLWVLEYLSSIVLPFYPILFHLFLFLILGLSPTYFNLESREFLFSILGFGSIFSLISGLLGGGQLTLLLNSPNKVIKNENILATNYLGTLIAAPFVIYMSEVEVSYTTQACYVGFFQFFGSFILILTEINYKKIRLLLLLIPLASMTIYSTYSRHIEYIASKSLYLNPKFEIADLLKVKKIINVLDKFGHLKRHKTPYQMIEEFTVEKYINNKTESTTTFYLNRKIQFNNLSSAVYHESMLFGALNFANAPIKNVLILGGGDGVLLNMLQSELPKSLISIVELDPGMIAWAKKSPFLLNLNKNVFDNIKSELIIDDAISYLRKIQNKKKFDLIFIDFPFPKGQELLKLYSVEFYSLVKNVSHLETIVTIDIPININSSSYVEKETLNILNSIKASGFNTIIGFGPHSSFVTTRLSNRPLVFDYQKISKKISLAAKINLFPIIDDKYITQKERPNSIFWPKKE